jgi:tRNA (guanine37-N1)-methyltransferase
MADDGPYPVHLVTLFPEFFQGPGRASIVGRARESGAVSMTVWDIRDFAQDSHRTTDDSPYGGGAGMVMKPGPVVRAIEAARESTPEAPRVLMTPQGERFSQSTARQFSQGPGLILVCGRYEGVDERVREGWIDAEVSVGDFVMSGGEPAAMAVADAVIRLLPGVLGNRDSLEEESFGGTSGMLEYPHYTRPQSFRGRTVPEVLLSGDHGRIDAWREAKAEERTRQRRPDLMEAPQDGDGHDGDDSS